MSVFSVYSFHAPSMGGRESLGSDGDEEYYSFVSTLKRGLHERTVLKYFL